MFHIIHKQGTVITCNYHKNFNMVLNCQFTTQNQKLDINGMSFKDKIFTLKKIINGWMGCFYPRKPQILITKSNQHSPFETK